MTVRQITPSLGDCQTVSDLLRAGAETWSDREAFVEVAGDDRRALSFGAWDAAADAVAALLADRGLGRGDVLALLLPSSIDYAIAYQAAIRLGAVTTGLNLRLGPPEQASIMARARPRITVVDTDLIPAAEVPPGSGTVLPRVDLAGAVAASGPAPRLPALDPADPVAIVWTSGSTGIPKGALFDHRNLAAVAAGTDVLSAPGDRRLSPLPFPHVGYMTRPWDEIAQGITTVIVPQPWTAASTLRLMEAEQVTVGQGVPTQWALVLAHPAFDDTNLSGLRVAGTGASRVPPELVRAMRERLGCPVVVRYTSTETSLGTGTRPGDPDGVVATTVGRPVPGVELELVAEKGGPVLPEEVGRVRLRSGASFRGYVATGTTLDLVATASVLDDAGWVTTGDLGRLDHDGNLQLVGRVSEMYIRGGYNVYPAEVEAVLGGCPGVAQVAVAGRPDPVLGEIGVAYVVVDPAGPPVDLAGLRRFAAGLLTDYKAPDRLQLLAELPLTAMAKVDKRTLAARPPDLDHRPDREPTRSPTP